ncbi:hypothetical protein Cus16_0432 [Curtobacterium sp. ER1/6]|nr:hypothetical protein Cus16_0432 [Curtobacterium sp. ER1/6]
MQLLRGGHDGAAGAAGRSAGAHGQRRRRVGREDRGGPVLPLQFRAEPVGGRGRGCGLGRDGCDGCDGRQDDRTGDDAELGGRGRAAPQQRDALLGDAEHEALALDVHDDDAGLAADALATDDLDRGGPTTAALRRGPEAALRRATVQHPHQGEHDAERDGDPEGHPEGVHGSDRLGDVEDLGDADRVVLVDDDDLAVRDEPAVQEDVRGGAGAPVELDDGAGLHAEDVADRHPGAPDLDRQGHLDVVDPAEVAGGQRPRDRRCRHGAVLADPDAEPAPGDAAGGELEDHRLGVGEQGRGGLPPGVAEHPDAEHAGGGLERRTEHVSHVDQGGVGTTGGDDRGEVGEDQREVRGEPADERRDHAVHRGLEGDGSRASRQEDGGQRGGRRELRRERLGRGGVEGGGGAHACCSGSVVVTTMPARHEPFAPTAAVPTGSPSTAMVRGRCCGCGSGRTSPTASRRTCVGRTAAGAKCRLTPTGTFASWASSRTFASAAETLVVSSPSCGSTASAGSASVPGATRSPTRIEKDATIIRSPFCAAWANWLLNWKPPVVTSCARRPPNEYRRSSRASSTILRTRACSMGVKVRSGVGSGFDAPSACDTHVSAASSGTCSTPFGAVSAIGSSTMPVRAGREAAYSSYVVSSTCSHVTWLTARTLAVSCVPHWRANVSNASSRTRACSRASVDGRAKSYTSGAGRVSVTGASVGRCASAVSAVPRTGAVATRVPVPPRRAARRGGNGWCGSCPRAV